MRRKRRLASVLRSAPVASRRKAVRRAAGLRSGFYAGDQRNTRQRTQKKVVTLGRAAFIIASRSLSLCARGRGEAPDKAKASESNNGKNACEGESDEAHELTQRMPALLQNAPECEDKLDVNTLRCSYPRKTERNVANFSTSRHLFAFCCP